jgi:hypothetical protein
MSRARIFLAVLTGLFLVGAVLGADTPPDLSTAKGVIDKVEKDSITIRPRGPDGKFEKSVTLHLTGSSKVATLTTRAQKDKVVLVQKDTAAQDLQPKQTIAVIYANGADGPVLLSAVVQPAADK